MKTSHLLLAGLLSLTGTLAQAETTQFEINIKNHKFEPAILVVPTGQKIKLKVNNLDPTPEEFESYVLNREKIIPGGKSAIIFIGPLEAGEYEYFGEFNQASAQGKIIAK